MSTGPDKTNNKHHYDVILSLRSGRRALCPSKRTTRERNGHTQNCSLLLNVTKRHAMLPVGSMRAGRVRRLGSESRFVGQPQVESS
jgi:hypothetical protein